MGSLFELLHLIGNEKQTPDPLIVLIMGSLPLHKKATIYQVATMLTTSKYAPFPGHNHLLTNGTDDPSLAGAWVIIKVSGHQYRWLAGGHNLEIGHF